MPMNMDLISDTLKFAITLVSILNPIGVIPIFLNLTSRYSDQGISSIATSCSIAVFLTITISLFIGQYLLNFFGITIATFTIGGGVLLFSIAFSMVQAQHSETKINEQEMEFTEASREIGVVPLAIPLLSGPGSISTTIIQSNTFTNTWHWVGAVLVIAFLCVIINLTLTYSRVIGKKLGTIGLNIMTRVMGIILLAISIEMIINGLKVVAKDF